MDGGEIGKPKVPADLTVPGLIYRLRRRGWVLSWSPRSDLVERGYQGKTSRLWPSDTTPRQQSEPTRAEWEVISAWCVRYHAEQLLWARGGVDDDPKSLFDGTVGSLIEIYQKHKKSPFQKLRYKTSIVYAAELRILKAVIGKVRVSQVTFDAVSRWQDEFESRASRMIGHVHRIHIFGALVLHKSAGCHDVCDMFAKMAEGRLMESARRRRKEYMTAAQCRLLRAKAHEKGHPSVALQQAFAFELGLRQADVIGEWVPVKWPGLSDIVRAGKKWMMGLRWEEIGANFVLRHRLSKSVRGAKAILDPNAGNTEEFDLTAYPMVMDELRRFVGKDSIERSDLPASGPVIVNETTSDPWSDRNFRYQWRQLARAAGIPDNIQSRDSRPGAATEAKLAGAPRDDIQRQLGHAKGETTEIYLRENLEEKRKLAKLRAEKRKP